MPPLLSAVAAFSYVDLQGGSRLRLPGFPLHGLRIPQELLEGLGSPSLPAQIDVDKELLKNTFLYCKETRARYTILQMLWDLGVLEETADAVIAEL